jgi:ATP-dependent RNA helicase RhlE
MVPEDYVHRVGRTARAKALGDAITFVSPDEEKYFAQIERALGRRLDRSKTPELPPPVAGMPSMAPVAAGPRRPQRQQQRRRAG